MGEEKQEEACWGGECNGSKPRIERAPQTSSEVVGKGKVRETHAQVYHAKMTKKEVLEGKTDAPWGKEKVECPSQMPSPTSKRR